MAAWQAGLKKSTHSLRYPSTHPTRPTSFSAFCLQPQGRYAETALTPATFVIWDSVLSPCAGRLQQSPLVKYDPRNLSRIYVRDPHGRHWPVSYADLRRPPITLWELEEANKLVRQNGRSTHLEQAIFTNILEQRQTVKEAGSLSKQRRRQEKAPARPHPSRTILDNRSETTVRMTEIKPYPVEIWEGE
jgi:putative transposase